PGGEEIGAISDEKIALATPDQNLSSAPDGERAIARSRRVGARETIPAIHAGVVGAAVHRDYPPVGISAPNDQRAPRPCKRRLPTKGGCYSRRRDRPGAGGKTPSGDHDSSGDARTEGRIQQKLAANHEQLLPRPGPGRKVEPGQRDRVY